MRKLWITLLFGLFLLYYQHFLFAWGVENYVDKVQFLDTCALIIYNNIMFNIDYSAIKTDKVNTSTIHNYTVFCIFNWCLGRGLTPILEKPEKYFLESEKKIKNGKIDVGVFQGDDYKIAFEVDFSLKPQSLAKLKLCDAKEKYWIIIERGVEPINKNYFYDDVKVIFLTFD